MQLVKQGKIDVNRNIVNYMGGLKYQNNIGEPVRAYLPIHQGVIT